MSSNIHLKFGQLNRALGANQTIGAMVPAPARRVVIVASRFFTRGGGVTALAAGSGLALLMDLNISTTLWVLWGLLRLVGTGVISAAILFPLRSAQLRFTRAFRGGALRLRPVAASLAAEGKP